MLAERELIYQLIRDQFRTPNLFLGAALFKLGTVGLLYLAIQAVWRRWMFGEEVM